MTVFFATLLLGAAGPDLVDLKAREPRLALDIRYATADNFVGKQLYPLARCLLRRQPADMLLAAQRWLDRQHPGYVLMLKDCYRPLSVQRELWRAVEGTPKQAYVANPQSVTGSVHNYGAAVDLTLQGPDGKEVDMGTPYDHLGPLAEPRKEEEFLRDGKLSAAQLQHRRLLREAMVVGGGFKAISNEWWHFDALQGRALRATYDKLDVPLDAAVALP